MKFAVGLTGGIGCGKSTVAAVFEGLGASVIDTDNIARELTSPGGAAMGTVRDAFGAGFITADGALDRPAMRKAAFTDANVRAKLESILHPLIGAASTRALQACTGPYAMLVVPLLFESRNLLRQVARTLVVDCPEALQVERVMRRSGLEAGEVRAISATQWPRWRRLQMADDVVWNGGPPGALDGPCRRLHSLYLELARGT